MLYYKQISVIEDRLRKNKMKLTEDAKFFQLRRRDVFVHVDKQSLLNEKYIGYITGVIAQAYNLNRAEAYALIEPLSIRQARTIYDLLVARTSQGLEAQGEVTAQAYEVKKHREGKVLATLLHSLIQMDDWDHGYALLSNASKNNIDPLRVSDLSLLFRYKPELFKLFEQKYQTVLNTEATQYLNIFERQQLAKKTALVVMAGGEGTRMGNVCKAMLKLSGRPLIQHHINTAQLLGAPILGVCLPNPSRHPDWHHALGTYATEHFSGLGKVVLTENHDVAWSEQLLEILAAVKAQGAESAILVMGDSILRQDLLVNVFANNHQSAIGFFTGAGGGTFVETAQGNILSYAGRVGKEFVYGAQEVVWKINLLELDKLRQADGLSNWIAQNYRQWGCEYTALSVANMNDPVEYSRLKDVVFGFPQTIIGHCPSLTRTFLLEHDVREFMLKRVNCKPKYINSLQINYKGSVWKVESFGRPHLLKYFNQKEDASLRLARSWEFMQVTDQPGLVFPEDRVLFGDFYQEGDFQTLHKSFFEQKQGLSVLRRLARFVSLQLNWLQAQYAAKKELLAPLPLPSLAEHDPIDTGSLTYLDQLENTLQNLIKDYAQRNPVYAGVLSSFAELLSTYTPQLLQWQNALVYTHGDYSDYNVFLRRADYERLHSVTLIDELYKEVVQRSPIIDGEYARLAPQGVDYASFIVSLLERGELELSVVPELLDIYIHYNVRTLDSDAKTILWLFITARLISDLWFMTNVVFDLQAAGRYLKLLAKIMQIQFNYDIGRLLKNQESIKVVFDKDRLTPEFCRELLGKSRKQIRPVVLLVQASLYPENLEKIIQACRELNSQEIHIESNTEKTQNIDLLRYYADKFGIKVKRVVN